jgi:hypothetical protein
MRNSKFREDRLSTENEDNPQITIKEVQGHCKVYGVNITVEQAEKIQLLIHRLAKIALNQILRGV